jgi:hypothetical protein
MKKYRSPVKPSFNSLGLLHLWRNLGLVLLASMLFNSSLQAAEDGEIGATSAGQLTIRLFIDEGVQIANLNDVVVETTRDSVSGNLTLNEEFCIKGTVGSQFQIETSTNVLGGSEFALIGDQGDALNYRVVFNTAFAGSASPPLNPNRLFNQVGATVMNRVS